MKKIFLLLSLAALLTGCGSKNTTIDDIMTRTSIRQYTDEPVSDSDMETLLRAGMAAPSCCNIQPWHFVVVRDKALRQQLTDSIGPAEPAARAQAVIVVCGDMRIMRESPVKDNQDYWVCDACAATENILVAANSMDLGAVWLGVWPMKNRISLLQQILSLPEYIIPLDMIAVGHPPEQPEPKDKWKPERIHQDKW